MNLFKFNGTNSVQHWVNPLKVIRVTLTPESTTMVPGTPTEANPTPEPSVIVNPASLVVHLDGGFAVQVADDATDLLDKLDKLD